MNGSTHASIGRSPKRMGIFMKQPGSQCIIPLLDNNSVISKLLDLCSEIRGNAVFFFAQQNNTDNSRELKAGHRNIGYGQHQGTVIKTALCPEVLLWKRVSSVTFDVSDAVMKNIRLIIYGDLTVDFVCHTVHTVSALQERNKGKGAHDVISNGGKRLEAEGTINAEVVVLNVYGDALLRKAAISKLDR